MVDLFTTICALLHEFLDAHPTLVDEELRTHVADTLGDIDSAQLTRALGTVRRARAERTTTPMLEGLTQAGIVIPPAAFTGPQLVVPERTYASDDLGVPTAFRAAYARLARAYERPVKDETRREYFEHLTRDEGCTLEELVQAVPLLLRSKQSWPRITDWYSAALAVRRRIAARAPSVRNELTVDPITGNAAWRCARCRDAGWRPSCGCSVEDLDYQAGERDADGNTKVPGYCYTHPRPLYGVGYRPSYVRCECGQQAVAL